MKISKSLLQIMAVAITVGTSTSCIKKKLIIEPKEEKPGTVVEPNPINPGYNCPACGLG